MAVTMNLYTVDWKSWQSVVIMLRTKSIFTHSGIQVGKKLFEASGHKGTLGWVPADTYEGREVKKITLPVSDQKARAILKKYDNLEYDYKALVFWCFSVHDKKKFYCFELCKEFLEKIGLSSTPSNKKITAQDLLDITGDLDGQ